MALGEHVLAVEFAEDLLRRFLRHAPGSRSIAESLPAGPEERLVVAAAERPSKLISLIAGEACYIHSQLVHLVLEDDGSQGALQGALLQGMVVGNRLFARPSGQVAIGGMGGSHARPDPGHPA